MILIRHTGLPSFEDILDAEGGKPIIMDDSPEGEAQAPPLVKYSWKFMLCSHFVEIWMKLKNIQQLPTNANYSAVKLQLEKSSKNTVII